LDERAEVSETGGLSFVQMRYGISAHTNNQEKTKFCWQFLE
jgi:hypothetical protein